MKAHTFDELKREKKKFSFLKKQKLKCEYIKKTTHTYDDEDEGSQHTYTQNRIEYNGLGH